MSPTAEAMLFDRPGAPLRRQEVARPIPAAGEVLVEVVCCTICGSDLHTYEGRRSTSTPTVLGHEILGRIAGLSNTNSPIDITGSPLRIGDRVTWSIAVHCGSCFFCKNGLPQKCEVLFKYGHEPFTEHAGLCGGLADYCLLKAGTSILRVPDELPDNVACPINCATATAASAIRTGEFREGDSVLILGAGMLGLTTAAMCRSQGALDVFVCDLDSDRLQRAASFGATRCFHPVQEQNELRKAVDRTTNTRGVDLVLEMCGSTAAGAQGFDLLRIGGRMILVGAVFSGPRLEIEMENIVRRMIRIEGVHNYQPADLIAAMEFLTEHHSQFPFESLIERTFERSQADQAFQYAASSGALRVAVASK